MRQISSQEQTDNNDSEVSSLELKSIQVSTFQDFFIQENCNLHKFFPFYALLKFQQVRAYKREVIQHWSIRLFADFFKNEVLKRDYQVPKTTASYYQRHDVPNNLLDILHHQYLHCQLLPLQDSSQVQPYHFLSRQIHYSFLFGLLDFHIKDATLDNVHNPSAVYSPQNLQPLRHFPLKPVELVQADKCHDLDHIKNRRLPRDHLYDLISFGLDRRCGDLVEWLSSSHSVII